MIKACRMTNFIRDTRGSGIWGRDSMIPMIILAGAYYTSAIGGAGVLVSKAVNSFRNHKVAAERRMDEIATLVVNLENVVGCSSKMDESLATIRFATHDIPDFEMSYSFDRYGELLAVDIHIEYDRELGKRLKSAFLSHIHDPYWSQFRIQYGEAFKSLIFHIERFEKGGEEA